MSFIKFIEHLKLLKIPNDNQVVEITSN